MRVLHAPVEISGQMEALTGALREVGADAHSLVLNAHEWGYKADMALNLNKIPSRGARYVALLRNLYTCIKQYDLFHFHFGESLLPHNRDLPLLKALGKRIVFHFWGTDIRRRSLAPVKELARREEEGVIRHLRYLSKYADLVLVADGELESYVHGFFPRVELLPQALDLRQIANQPLNHRHRPVVLHAPSKRAIKGTEHVIRAVDSLCRQGIELDFRLIENVPHAQLLQAIAEADIVVDQLKAGTYGIFALEAMAVGRPVICHIHPSYRSSYPDELPVVSADIQTVETELRRLVLDAELRSQLAVRGRKYVEQYHDSHMVARKLSAIYASIVE